MTTSPEELKKIEQSLDLLGVPGTGLTWERIQQYVDGESAARAALIVQQLPTEAWSETEVAPSVPVSAATAEPELEPEFQFSEDQTQAWSQLEAWLAKPDPYFVLRGFAGTGKTFLMRKFQEFASTKSRTVLFTAPTNKATKVLSKSVGKTCRTTYSQLGLRMEQKDDKLVLRYADDRPYIPAKAVLVIDECSMIGKDLYRFIDKTQAETGCKVLYVGDPAQLPPVGEAVSPSWKATLVKDHRALLKQVMRYDNELLALSMKIRNRLKDKNWTGSPIRGNHREEEGVWLYKSQHRFIEHIVQYGQPQDFLSRKVLCWRNRTVDRYNSIIRENFGFTKPYEPGDIVLVAEPVEQNGTIVAQIDEEFTVEAVKSSSITLDERYPVWMLQCRDEENKCLKLMIPKDWSSVDRYLSELAATAREAPAKDRRRAWQEFWSTRNLFNRVRYGYAMTVHRSQGSTYEEVMVDQTDILSNRDKREAFRCLYVSCTRPTKRLITY